MVAAGIMENNCDRVSYEMEKQGCLDRIAFVQSIR